MEIKEGSQIITHIQGHTVTAARPTGSKNVVVTINPSEGTLQMLEETHTAFLSEIVALFDKYRIIEKPKEVKK